MQFVPEVYSDRVEASHSVAQGPRLFARQAYSVLEREEQVHVRRHVESVEEAL